MSRQIMGDTEMKKEIFKGFLKGSLGVIFIALGVELLISGIRDKSLIALISVVVLPVGCLLLLQSWMRVFDFVFTTFTRPIVHVWEHNGVTRVIPHIDWELWHQTHERNLLAGLATKNSRPNPEIEIEFSDIVFPKYSGLLTGTMDQYRKLVQGCRVEKSESMIVLKRCVDFPTAWELVHGPDSKSPEE